jgi:methionyl-tRNA formyltransferase
MDFAEKIALSCCKTCKTMSDTKKIKTLFIGSAELACPSLKALYQAAFCDISAVISQPPKPRGRSLISRECPVSAIASSINLPVFTPHKINAPESVEKIASFKPDLIVVVAYGQILSSSILTIPSLGCINLHASLLPEYRGAAPIQWAIANGNKVTGVTIIFLNERMDEGDIIKQREEPIFDDDTAATLSCRLGEKGAELLLEVVSDIVRGNVKRIPQDHSKATYAPKLKKEDGLIDWKKSASELERRIRAFNPWPGCHTQIPLEEGACSLKIFRAKVELSPSALAVPGTVLEVKDGLIIQTGENALRLLEVQAEGKKRMDCISFLCGHRVKPGIIIS